jgi:small-conductance mechanosensitive channel
MGQLTWGSRSNLVMVYLAVLLIIASASLAPIAGAQPETTPEAAVTSEATKAPEAATTPEAAATSEAETTPEAAATLEAETTPEQTTTSTPVPNQQTSFSNLPESINIRNWTLSQWGDLATSLIILVVIATIGGRLLIWLGKQIARRTSTNIDDQLISTSRRPVNLLAATFGFQVAYSRLDFMSAAWQTFFGNVSFILYTILFSVIVWVIIDYGLIFYRDQARKNDANLRSIDRLLPLVRTFVKGFLVVVGFIIIMHHFGVEVVGLIAALGLTGFALSLAAKDTLTNIIAGISIAISQPFRINDRIFSEEVDGWVDVIDIGLRSTRVLTRDNRMVIIPNSSLSDKSVINYTFPDRSYRLQVDIGIAYGTDFNTARQVLHNAVCQVDGVMTDKAVQVLFIEFGESAMIYRLRWWIANYADMREINDQVYQAVQEALETHKIGSPGPVLDVNYHVNQEDADRLASAFQTRLPHESKGPDDRTETEKKEI